MNDMSSPLERDIVADALRSATFNMERAIERSYRMGFADGRRMGIREVKATVAAIPDDAPAKRRAALDGPLGVIQRNLDLKNAPPATHTPAQDEGGVIKTGDDAAAAPAGVSHFGGQSSSFVEQAGAEEGSPQSVDPAPAADDEQNSPETASEEVGGVTGACSASQCGENRTANAAANSETGGESAATHSPSDEHLGAQDLDSPAEARPSASPSVKASDTSEVGAAPAVIDERPPQSISAPPTKYDQTLDLWATTVLTKREIAKQIRSTEASVGTYLSVARRKDDPRFGARKPAAVTVDAAAPAPFHVEKPEPASNKPAVLVKTSTNLVGKDEAGIFIAIEPVCLTVEGPLGLIDTNSQIVSTLARMISGGLFDHRSLAAAGRWKNLNDFILSIPVIQARLIAIGIEFVDVKKVGCRIRRAVA